MVLEADGVEVTCCPAQATLLLFFREESLPLSEVLRRSPFSPEATMTILQSLSCCECVGSVVRCRKLTESVELPPLASLPGVVDGEGGGDGAVDSKDGGDGAVGRGDANRRQDYAIDEAEEADVDAGDREGGGRRSEAGRGVAVGEGVRDKGSEECVYDCVMGCLLVCIV